MANEQNEKYIFLVDDEPIQNEMLKDYISERVTHKIKLYDTGESALADMHLHPEIVVLDYHLSAHLPEAQDGVEVLKKIKEVSPATHVIMLSGQDKLEVAVDSMKYGAYDYIVKGETAFSRVQNILNNIDELNNIRAANNKYKRVIRFLYIAIGVALAASAVLIIAFR